MTATPPFTGTTVVDLSDGIAGAYCSKILADAGATVIRVEPPGGATLRRWSASGTPVADGDDAPLFSFLASSTQCHVVDPENDGSVEDLLGVLAHADVVVWSPESTVGGHDRLAPIVLTTAFPHLRVVAITPFGLDGPWTGRPATEFTLQAWSGGIIGLGRGAPDRAPVQVGGRVGEWLSGLYAAIGAMISLGRHDDAGELVDVSMLETMALCLTYFPVTYHDMVGRPFRTGRSVMTPGVEMASDGLVGVGVGTGQQWLDFCVMVDHAEWMEDRKLFADRAHLRPEISAWMAEHTRDEILELARTFRIPHAPIGNGVTIPETDHFVARGSIVPNPRDGFGQPGPPYRFDPPLLRAPTPAPRPETTRAHTGTSTRADAESHAKGTDAEGTDAGVADGGLPLAGLRVLDLTAFWAGPLCTHVLGMLGAEVIHVESTVRPDGTRMLAGLRFSEPHWWEQSGIFAGLNSNKESVTLDLARPEGRELLQRLLDSCDVVVENYTPRVLEQLGIDLEAARATRPELIAVRMPGFGLDGPWRDNPAFAFVIEDAAGLTWLTGHPDDNPVSPYGVADANAGLHALSGVLVALEHRRQTGEGALVEAAMLDAALNVAAEGLVEATANGVLLQRAGNRGPTAAPQNLYLTSDSDPEGKRDTWVAVAIETDAQWAALVDALSRPDWALDPALATIDGRRVAHDDIDRHLGAWCDARSADDVVGALWPAGVPVARVMQPHEQTDLPPLLHREFFESVDHPIAGAARHSTVPIRFSRGPRRFHRRHAPLVGEHNAEVLGNIGVTPERLAELAADGVIGSEPAR